MNDAADKPGDGTEKPAEGTNEPDGGPDKPTIRWQKLIEYLVLWSVVCVLSILVLVILLSFFWDLYSITSDKPAITVVNALQRIPTDWRVYAFAVAVAGLWVSWRFYLKTKLKEKLALEIEDTRRQGLNDRDWWAYRGFRERALSLRARAGMILGGVFALLFGGIYFIAFIVPELEVQKERIVRKAIFPEPFQKIFSNKLEAISEGRHWFKTYSANLNQPTTRISLVKFSGASKVRYRFSRTGEAIASGVNGLIAFRNGTAVMTRDGGQTWSPINIALQKSEYFIAAKFIDEKERALLVSWKGSVFVREARRNEWERLDAQLEKDERVTAVAFSDNGEYALLVGDENSVRLMKYSGAVRNWVTLDLKRRKRIFDAIVSADTKRAVLIGDSGTVYATKNSGDKWRQKNLELKRREDVVITVHSNDEMRAFLVGDDGSTFSVSVNKDAIHSSNPIRSKLKKREEIITSKFSDNGKYGLLVGSQGSFLKTRDSGKRWETSNIIRYREERIYPVAISNDGKIALLMGREGSIYTMKDSGQNLIPRDLKLKTRIRSLSAVISNDGKRGLINVNDGLIFITKDGGQSWEKTQWDQRVSELVHIAIVPLGKNTHTMVAVDDKGNAHLLKDHPDLKEWNKLSLEDMAKNKFMRNNQLFKEMSAFLITTGGFPRNKPADKANNTQKDKSKSPNNNTLDDILRLITLMQISTMTILFFLVQLLVRLYQYSMRLANFWDSRADAILLQQNFAEDKAKRFDDLVQALAPDAYDFKSMPRSAFDWLPWSRRNQ